MSSRTDAQRANQEAGEGSQEMNTSLPEISHRLPDVTDSHQFGMT